MLYQHYKTILVHLIYLLGNPVLSIKFYEGTKSVQYDCNVKFEPGKEFTCACISGVWKIFKSECEEIRTVGGFDYCFEFPSGDIVTRAEKILDNIPDISIRFQNGSLVKATEGISFSLDTNDIITTGADWSIMDSAGSVRFCLSPTTDNFCQFSVAEPIDGNTFKKGCSPDATKIVPRSCENIKKRSGNVCENSKQGGRVFLLAPGMNSTIISDPTKLNDTDEDFYIKENITESRDEVSTEIWNFIDKGLDKILKIDLSTAAPIQNYSTIPAFHLLQLARDVMKKTCPGFYVNPQFFDMATHAFINMQKKAFKQEDFPIEFFAYLRIKDALKNCSASSEAYPFVNNFTCADNGEPTGAYINQLNTSDEINIAFASLPNSREPIIETAWKIFYNTHSHCFPYFDASYNDHHRFTTWLTPLFQNNIHDIWLNGTSKNIVFGNMFGNMGDIQQRVAYCTAYSRLESDYPWDLPIPQRMEPYITNSSSPGARRKRGISNPGDGHCIAPAQLPKC